jgi:hypothetical protein
MKQVAQTVYGTDTIVYPEPRRVYPACPGLQGEPQGACAPGLPRALGFSSLRRHSPELEGAPPLVSKGGLLRSNAKASLLFAPSVALP